MSEYTCEKITDPDASTWKAVLPGLWLCAPVRDLEFITRYFLKHTSEFINQHVYYKDAFCASVNRFFSNDNRFNNTRHH